MTRVIAGWSNIRGGLKQGSQELLKVCHDQPLCSLQCTTSKTGKVQASSNYVDRRWLGGGGAPP